MKTKNILSILILIGFMSCSKEFTDLSPISERNTGSFFTTANDMEVAVTGVYNSLLSQGVYNEAIWIMNDLRSDNSFWTGGGLAESIIRYDDFEETTTDYGKKLIKNEILGQSWISNQMNESKKNLIYNYEIKNKGCFKDFSSNVTPEMLIISKVISMEPITCQ